jgi:hypothetical protein
MGTAVEAVSTLSAACADADKPESAAAPVWDAAAAADEVPADAGALVDELLPELLQALMTSASPAIPASPSVRSRARLPAGDLVLGSTIHSFV